MPGDAGRIAWRLGEQRRGPANDVGPQHSFDGIQDSRICNQIKGPGQKQMNLGGIYGTGIRPLAFKKIQRVATGH